MASVMMVWCDLAVGLFINAGAARMLAEGNNWMLHTAAKRLLGLSLAAMLCSPTIASQSVRLACVVSSTADRNNGEFSALLCEEAVKQLEAVSLKSVELVPAEMLGKQADEPWLRLDFVIKSLNAVSGQAFWGDGPVQVGEGRLLDAGVDDNTLNRRTAALLVKALIADSPFQQ
jgi:hypothetical protein